ncbi:UDP-N-acetylglucosamine--dolichyl-phosphate N-acetylglucosaminephosphotransferase-like isoform X1 [Clytia hemisphaerica]
MTKLLFPIAINALYSLFSFFLALRLIPGAKDLFLKAGLKGKDLNKKEKNEIPESLGVICGTVFLICMFLFIPVPFVTRWMENMVGQEQTVFPHNEFVEFIAALLSICCMILLGYADDTLDLKWRYKLILPTLASLPLLMVYFVNFGSTTIVIPKPLRDIIGINLNLGIFYYVYMGMLAVFCTNAINILAGVNGLETSQSVIIGISILVFNFMELSGDCWKSHLFSIYFLLPYVAASSALLYHNWYPSSVFVGDTFCYFSGMTFAVVAILGHFSKTMLLFFIPQILNFLYSVPQLFRFIPCPRHRLPSYDSKTDKLELSTTQFKTEDLNILGKIIVKIVSTFRIGFVQNKKIDKDEYTVMSNLTLINFVIFVLGPMHEKRVTQVLMAIQVLGSCLAFFVRYQLARLFYDTIKC